MWMISEGDDFQKELGPGGLHRRIARGRQRRPAEQGVGVPVSAQRASRQTGTVEIKRAARARRGVDDGLQIANRIAHPSCLDQEETIFETGTAEGNLLGDGRQQYFGLVELATQDEQSRPEGDRRWIVILAGRGEGCGLFVLPVGQSGRRFLVKTLLLCSRVARLGLEQRGGTGRGTRQQRRRDARGAGKWTH